ncbi:MAG: hypothetical protein M0Q38_09485 [Bacteroidales bacterium]|jgi:hypothetical protein|nr:hypothetical protein [Bacteroidales bacterium]
MKHKILLVLLFLLSGTMALNAQEFSPKATYTVGSGGTYSTLKAAFDAINAGSITGAITLQITSSITDNSSAVLNASGGSASYTSVNIYPTVSGVTLSGSYGGPLIDFNGADNVIIDGRVNATGFTYDMAIINTSGDGNSSTIRFTNDATYNTVEYCKIKGSTPAGDKGIVYFSPTVTTAGNSHNTIDHNEITNYGGNRPLMTIFSKSTNSSVSNSLNTISNNNIHDVLNPNNSHSFIINLGDGSGGGNSYNDAWTITGNSFYEAEAFTITSGNNMEIIYIYADAGNGFIISNNYFGGSAPLCGGTWNKTTGNNTFQLMEFRVGTSTASEIQGNTIKNINFTNTGSNKWWGINMQRGKINIGTTAGNCYGASDGTGSITFTGNGSGSEFYAFHSESSVVNAQNNIIGSITVANTSSTNATNFYGILFRSNGTSCYLSNNTIGSITTSNSINATSQSTIDAQKVWGIACCFGSSGKVTIINNTIANLTNGTTNSSSTVYGQMYGIFINQPQATVSGNSIHHLTIANANAASDCSTGDPGNQANPYISAAGIAFANKDNSTDTLSGNTIYNISNTYSSFTGHVAGIYYYGQSTASSVSGNLIYGLSVNSGSNSATIHGIKIANGVAAFSNNIITLGGNTTTNLYGIYDGNTSGTSNIYFNSVYLNGSPTSGSLNSAGLYNSTTANARDYRNNIFFNTRSNNGANGKHYAMYIQNTGGSLTCNYNDYWVGVLDNPRGYYGGDKTSLPIVTSQDTGSQVLDPTFATAGGNNASDYIPTTLLPAATATGITTDYGGSTRSVSSPEMGAWEKKNELTWTGGTSTDWSVTDNWDLGSVPISSSNVRIPAAPSNKPHITAAVGTPAVCNNLTIDENAVLTIDPGKALTVNGTLINNEGATGLVIQSDATGTGSLIQSSSSVGATVQRYITGSATLTEYKYHLVSIPVNYASPTSNLFLGSYLYKLDAAQVDPDNNNYYGLWVNLGTSTTTPLSCNSGYMIYYPAAEHTYTFSGNLNTGSFSPTVSFGGTYTFNLVPNPYPSAIDWGSSGGWVKSNIGATAYVWPAGGGNYTTITSSINNYIPAGQAFIVMASGTPVLTMNNSACVHNTQAFYKSTQANMLKITAQSNNYSDEAYVGFNSSAGSGFDPQLDGFKLWGLEEAPQLWTEKDQSRLSINELPPPAGALIVPLDFKTNYTGQVILNVSGVESFDPPFAIRLQDHMNGSWTDLRQNSTYVFTYDTSNTEQRFSLVFGYPAGINTNRTTDGKAFISNGRICLDVPSMHGQFAEITVYDMLGLIIRCEHKEMNGIVGITAELVKGVYVVRAATADQNFATKVINK